VGYLGLLTSYFLLTSKIASTTAGQGVGQSFSLSPIYVTVLATLDFAAKPRLLLGFALAGGNEQLQKPVLSFETGVMLTNLAKLLPRMHFGPTAR
jgi:hypothetical protein